MKSTFRKRPDVLPAPRSAPVGDDGRLAGALVRAGLVGQSDLDAARSGAAGALVHRLLDDGAVDDRALAQALSRYYELPLQDFRDVAPDPAALAALPAARASELDALPISVRDGVTLVAMLDPAPERVAAVADALSGPVAAAVAARRDLRRAMGSAYSATRDVASQLTEFEARDALRLEAARLSGTHASDEAPVVRVVQMILTQGLRERASDIHLEPYGDRVRVRYRVDGALKEVLDLPGSIGPGLVSRVKILANLNIVERRRPQDGQISTEVEGRSVDIRVATTPVVGGEKVVLRLLDKSRSLFQLEQLGMPPATVERYTALVHSPYGMVICAGPTGGGKTTTLYASLGELDSVERNIMTIEDPVEYTFDSINQIQINEQAGVTFAGGLRSILRQDPDVILVGEVRDVDTARIAVQSALTGHLVLSSLHATDAVSALYRLLDMGIESFLIASSVTAVVSQRLVRRSCTACAEPYDPSPDELEFLRAFGGEARTGDLVRGVGCHICSQTGFLERIGVYELLVVTDDVRQMIVDRAPHEEIRRVAVGQGMSTLQEEAIRLVLDGTTTAAEAMRAIYVAGV